MEEEFKDEEQGPTPRKRRKPRTYTRDLAEWNIIETQLLCRLWAKERCLYDPKHQSHLNKPVREKAVRKIVAELAKLGNVIMTVDQVTAKMGSLRAYFSGQISRSKRAKAKGGEYVSQWKFMDDLYFLETAIIPRIKTPASAERFTRPPGAISNKRNGGPVNKPKAEPLNNSALVEDSGDSMEHFTFTPHNQNNSEDDPDSALRYIMSSDMAGGVETPPINALGGSATPSLLTSSNSVGSADYAFCEMILKILVKVPEGEVKDMLKLKIHQEVLQAKYKTAASSTNGN